MRALTQALIIALAGIAAIVAVILASGRTAWPWIVAYWVTLTVKNLVDVIGKR